MFINKMRSTYAFGTLVTGPDHPQMHEMISATDLDVQVTNIKQSIILKTYLFHYIHNVFLNKDINQSTPYCRNFLLWLIKSLSIRNVPFLYLRKTLKFTGFLIFSQDIKMKH